MSINDIVLSEKLPERLKAARYKSNLSQKELAQLIDMTAASLSAYETGVKVPSLQVLVSIAKILNVSLDWLCGLIDEQSDSKMVTYWDVCNCIMRIGDRLGDGNFLIRKYTSRDVNEDTPAIIMLSSTINNFLCDYQRMRTLLSEKTIDEELFELWREKRKKQLSIDIDNSDLIQNSIDDDDLPF